jgi:hypothetical protein
MTTRQNDGAVPETAPPRSDEEMLRIARTALIANSPSMDRSTASRVLPGLRSLVEFVEELIASPQSFSIGHDMKGDVRFRDRTITISSRIQIERLHDGMLLISTTGGFGAVRLTPSSRARRINSAKHGASDDRAIPSLEDVDFKCTEADDAESRSPMTAPSVPGRSAEDPDSIDAPALLRDARIAVIALERIVAAGTDDVTNGAQDPWVLDWKSLHRITTVVEDCVISHADVVHEDAIDYASPWTPAAIVTDGRVDADDPRMKRHWMLRDQVPIIHVDMINDTTTISSYSELVASVGIDPVARMRMHAESEAMRLGPIGRRYAPGNGEAS